MGMANHTPVTSKNLDKTKRKIIINPNVLKKEIVAETLPFDNAVNNAEAKILQPENRNPNENIEKPLLVISKTFSLFSANICAILSPAKRESRNTKTEITHIKQKQMRTTFFNCFTFSLP